MDSNNSYVAYSVYQLIEALRATEMLDKEDIKLRFGDYDIYWKKVLKLDNQKEEDA
jgi:hypothetical protein